MAYLAYITVISWNEGYSLVGSSSTGFALNPSWSSSSPLVEWREMMSVLGGMKWLLPGTWLQKSIQKHRNGRMGKLFSSLHTDWGCCCCCCSPRLYVHKIERRPFQLQTRDTVSYLRWFCIIKCQRLLWTIVERCTMCHDVGFKTTINDRFSFVLVMNTQSSAIS